MNLKNGLLLKILLPVACWLSATFVSAFSADTLNLVFVGDLMQHKGQIVAAQRDSGKFSYKDCFRLVAPELKKADIAVGNLETTLGGKPYSGYPAFSAPDDFLFELKKIGMDVLLFANNHCLDRGKKGALRTLNVLDSMRLNYTGVFRDSADRLHRYPLLVEKKGFRIVFLNYTYGTNGIKPVSPLLVNYIDRVQIKKDVLKARVMKPDAIIACMHWGEEYKLYPRSEEKELADWLLSIGVDHVIGGHPHVVQPLQVIEGKDSPSNHLLVYSLGNFVSNMSASNTDGGMMVSLTLKKVEGRTRMIDCGYTFVWTSRPSLNGKGDYIIYPANPSDKRLNTREKARMNAYLRRVRKVVESMSNEIKEYFF